MASTVEPHITAHTFRHQGRILQCVVTAQRQYPDARFELLSRKVTITVFTPNRKTKYSVPYTEIIQKKENPLLSIIPQGTKR